MNQRIICKCFKCGMTSTNVGISTSVEKGKIIKDFWGHSINDVRCMEKGAYTFNHCAVSTDAIETLLIFMDPK